MGNECSVLALKDLFPNEDPAVLELIRLSIINDRTYESACTSSEKYKKERRLKRRRLQLFQHVRECLHDNTFHTKYRMTFKAFLNLVDVLRDDLQRDSRKCRYGSPIFPELIVAIGIRWMAGGDHSLIADLFRVSGRQVYCCRDSFMNAVISEPSLAISIPSTAADWEKVRKGFAEKSHDSLVHGMVGALDGFFQGTYQPTRKEANGNVLAYFSGHYKSYGLNCQACCDSDLRFLYFGVVAPGKTNDCVAFDRAVDMKKFIESLPVGLFVVGDAAYTLSENLLTPFTGVNRGDVNRDAYNFFLSQVRIRIEMAFGRLTRKWGILRNRLYGSQATCARVLLTCATLHNYCIDQQAESSSGEDDASSSSLSSADSGDFVIRSAPEGLAYLPTVDEEEELLDGNTPGYSHSQESILQQIHRENHRRPIANLLRNHVDMT